MIMQLFVWYFIWYLFYGIFNFLLVPHKISFRANKQFTIAYSFCFILAAILLFDKVNLAIISSTISIFLLLVAIVIAIAIDYTFLALHKSVCSHLGIRHRKTSPILARAAEVAFQQIMLFSLIRILAASAIAANYLVLGLCTGLGFLLAHIAILGLTRLSIRQRIFVIAAAFCAGIVFSYLILHLPYGWFFSYLLHLLFYYAIALLTGDDDELIP
jgi:hypothetical protein